MERQSPLHRNWKDFQDSAIADQDLSRRIAAKALNIPFPDAVRDVTVTKTLGWPAIALAAAGLLGGGGLLAWGFGAMLDTLQPPPVTVPAPGGADTDTRYDLRPLPGE